MKKTRIIIASLISVIIPVLIIAGCSSNKTFGTNPSAPSKLERSLFDVTPSTNFTQQISTVKNTNSDGVITASQSTNLIPVAGSHLQVSASTKETVVVGTSFLDTFLPGVGKLAGAALLGVLGAWGSLRGQKKVADTAPILAQNVETLLELIRAMPNGQQLHDTVTRFLYDHQQETGTVSTIAGLLTKYVSNPEAKDAAAEIQASIDALSKPKTPAA